MKIFKKAKRGFTLVELVVVIAVIAILAAVSVGAYFGVTESANKSKLEQESKQFHTAIQTVALIGNENHTLNADGLRVNDIETFEDAIEKQMGQDVEVLADVNPAEINKQTIVLNNTAVKEQNNGTLYKTFDYYTHEVSGKKIAVDTVTGEFKHYGNLNFKIDTEDTTEAEFFTVYFENNWSWPDPKVYFWGSEKVECEAFPGKELTNVVGHNDQNYDIYEVIIPIDADGFKFSGTGGYGSDESTDILVDDTNKAGNICYYMTYDNATSTKPCGSYEYDPNAVPEVPDTPDTPVDRASDYHIKGTVNGTNWDSEIIMNPVENTEDQFTITLTDCAVDSVFKVFSIENSNGWGFANVEQTDIYLGANGDYGDIEILVAGTYEVVFNSTTEKITYTYSGEGQPVTYEKTRVYFDNPENWEEVRVHYWGGQFGTTWPGEVMPKDGDYYTFEVESACTGLQFNNGQSGDNEKKTPDLTLDPTKPYYVNGEWVADPNATTEPENPGEGGETPSEPEVTINTKKVYFINNDLEPWTEVYVHYWGSTQTEETVWPGLSAHQDENNSKIWYFDVPNDVTGFIFNNKNNGKQTSDLIFEEGKDYYDCILKKFVESYCEHNFENNAVSCPLCNEENPNYEDPNAEKQHLYLKPSNSWKTDSARFALVLMDSNKGNHTWFNMVDTDGDGIYEAELDYSDFEYVIFCRMNPGAAENNWNNKWNQTSDLTIPTDGTNCYTVKEGTWDNGGGDWSTYTPAAQ